MRPLNLIACLSFTACLAAGQASLGSPDFYPSPERPIGHRGDGSGWFPGATPVTTWSDGTVTQPELEVRERGKLKKKKVWDIADSGAVNIAWRVPTPSWANTQPLVVGDLVLCYGEPDWLFCFDVHDGKLLWQRRVSAWRAAGLPAMEVATREAIHEVYGALEAWCFYRVTRSSTRGGLPSPKTFPALYETFARTCLPRMVADLERADPEVAWDRGAAAEKQICDALLQAVQAGERKSAKLPRVTDLGRMILDRIATIGDITVRLDTPWGHMVGHQMSCPVSDGRYVYVSMGQGQVAALDLTGRIVWAKLVPRDQGNEHHIRSPLLANGILVSPIGGHLLHAFDAATGEELWTAPFPGVGGNCRSVGTDQVVTLGTGDAAFKVIVTTHLNLIRLGDGTVLGQLPLVGDDGKPLQKIDGGPSMVSYEPGDGTALVFKGASGDNYGTAYTAFRLSPEGDAVRIDKVFDLGPKSVPGLHGIVATDRYLLGPMGRWDRNCVDIATGKVLKGDALRGSGDMSLIVAGTYAIAHDKKSESNGWGGRRPDQKMLCRFSVIDLQDPTAPKKVAEANVLGGELLPTFPPAAKYIPELWADERFVNGCGGRISHFIHLDTGITAAANRLFIRSTGHLYCIGDPQEKYSWNPQSRPAGIPLPAR